LTKNRGGPVPKQPLGIRSSSSTSRSTIAASYETSIVVMSNDISSLLQQTIRRTTHDIVAKDNARHVAETTSVAPEHTAADCASGRMRARWTCGAANSGWDGSIDGSAMSGGAHSV
jgi:hypothetical protein